MNGTFIISYTPGKYFLQRLNGTTKIILLLSSLCLIMISFDIRILLPIFILNFAFLLSIHPKWQQIRGLTYFIIWMNLLNIFLMYLVTPTIGTNVIGHETIWLRIVGRYVITPETLFYLGVRLLKVCSMFVSSLWFILSITPSELGYGLYRLHVPYKICTVVSLGLRSVPDVLRNYNEIKNSLQMRGLELDSKKTPLLKRLKQSVSILIPLLLSSFEKVERIADAMDLRLYGINKQRSYYTYQKPTKNDYFIRSIAIIEFLIIIFYSGLILFKHIPTIWYP
ncbi:energy-coupling factor transporter transmembrane protein EcfT [Limosilactobacillus reuteri]|uniref:energy-coupling factor transporter transmembrane component T family protein n=1 Tax=Limosilactobacillus reuteri TaxID=1598 RepID=UPI001E4D0273|nr:energy-coupling factor transporter transmembrane component T [Limosilactobacillus reuteri]MCC4422719.1 energy-coupling factor transporter transmembrane protein EcfT [Limosilactobacillus reuteri]